MARLHHLQHLATCNTLKHNHAHRDRGRQRRLSVKGEDQRSAVIGARGGIRPLFSAVDHAVASSLLLAPGIPRALPPSMPCLRSPGYMAAGRCCWVTHAGRTVPSRPVSSAGTLVAVRALTHHDDRSIGEWNPHRSDSTTRLMLLLLLLPASSNSNEWDRSRSDGGHCEQRSPAVLFVVFPCESASQETDVSCSALLQRASNIREGEGMEKQHKNE